MKRISNTWRALVLSMVLPFFIACEAIGPALTSLAQAFGQDLIATSAVNYAPRYATQMEALLIALTRQATGFELQAQLAQTGYQAPLPRYTEQQVAGRNDPYYQGQSTYGQYPGENASGYGNPYGDEPAQDGVYSNNYPDQTDVDDFETYDDGGYADDPYADDAYDDGSYADDTYADDAYDDGSYVDDGYADDTYDDGSYADDTYADGAYDDGNYADDAYANDVYREETIPGKTAGRLNSTRGIAPIQLNVALLARRAGQENLQPIDDGAVLFDGGNDPASGDMLKVTFQVNCACYVYVIGIDATGYVAQIYPEAMGQKTKPVRAGETYLLPGDSDWWALDEYKGIEQIYFLASFTARDDVETLLREMAGVPRSVTRDSYRPVAEPAVIPVTRGLVKVKGAPISIPTQSGSSQSVTPTLFSSKELSGEVVVTRWFNHE
ncbi:MAG: DUF4384 domain-containing protein [Gammaproteobacteria bacterium]|nr:DUF4384 domain-containing protein [Gammaproteobacteria bacterium]